MRKLFGVQYLRGAAAVAVVVFHSCVRAGVAFPAGEAGVDLFFLISGFIMVAITGPDTRPLRFIADRLRRIAPVYWIASSVTVAGALIGVFPNMELELGHVAASYFFVPWRSPNSGLNQPLLVQGWTLNFEIMFYIVFAALIPFGRKMQQIQLLTFLFASLVALRTVIGPTSAIASVYTDPLLLEFAAGCWLGIFWKRQGEWPSWLGLESAILAVTITVAMGSLGSGLHRVIVFGIPSALLLSSVLAMERRAEIRENKFASFIGDASYSIYIWHGLSISLTLAISHRLGLSTMPTILVGVAGGITIGALAYALIERPIIAYFRGRRFPGTTDRADLSAAGGNLRTSRSVEAGAEQ